MQPNYCSDDTLHRSPDQLLVVVQSLPGHILDEGGVLQLQLPRDGQQERRRVQDVHLHLRLLLSCVMLVLTLWRHLGMTEIMFEGVSCLENSTAVLLNNVDMPPPTDFLSLSPSILFKPKSSTNQKSYYDLLPSSGKKAHCNQMKPIT